MPLEEWIRLRAQARHLLSARRFEQALSLIARLIAARPDCAEARFLLVQALHATGKSKEALEEARAASALEPDNTSGLYWIAILSPRFRERKEAAQRAIGLEPRCPNWHTLLAFVLTSGREKSVFTNHKLEKEIEAAARQALAIDPEYTDALSLLFDSMIKQFRLPNAEKIAKRWVELAPEDERALASLALIRTMLFRFENTEELWRDSLHINPNDKWTQQQLALHKTRLRFYLAFETLFKWSFGRLPVLLQLPILSLFTGWLMLRATQLFQNAVGAFGAPILWPILLIALFSIIPFTLALRPYQARWPQFFAAKKHDETSF